MADRNKTPSDLLGRIATGRSRPAARKSTPTQEDSVTSQGQDVAASQSRSMPQSRRPAGKQRKGTIYYDEDTFRHLDQTWLAIRHNTTEVSKNDIILLAIQLLLDEYTPEEIQTMLS